MVLLVTPRKEVTSSKHSGLLIIYDLTRFSFAPAGGPLYAYSFGLSGGVPHFTLAGQSAMIFAGRGPPTVTSMGGQTGSGIVSLCLVK